MVDIILFFLEVNDLKHYGKKIISVLHSMKGILDDDYTLYNVGTILHIFDKHIYLGGQNIKEYLTIEDLSESIKLRILDAASLDNKAVVRTVLKL